MYKSSAIIIISIMIIALFSGCTEDKDKYFQKDLNDTLILYGDNAFTLVRPAKYDLSGAYRVDEDNLVLIYPPFGDTYILKIRRDRLIDPRDGTEWVKI